MYKGNLNVNIYEKWFVFFLNKNIISNKSKISRYGANIRISDCWVIGLMILWRKSWNLITNVTIFGFIGDIRTTKWETWITALLMLISCWRRMWKSSVTVLWIFTPTSARYNTLLSKYQFYFPNKSRCFFSLDELYLQLFFFYFPFL